MINTQSLSGDGRLKPEYAAVAYSEVAGKYVAYAGPYSGLVAFCKKHNLNVDDYK